MRVKYDGCAGLPTLCGPGSPLPPEIQICGDLSLICGKRQHSAGTPAPNDPTLYKVQQKRRLPMHSTEQIGPHDLVVVSIGVSTNASTRARCGDFSDELVEVLQQIYLNFLTCFSS
jgi:hypothetical protein